MNAALPTTTATPAGMHPDEWAARVELAACYRVFAMLGWTEMIYNHITLRLPASVTGGRRPTRRRAAPRRGSPLGGRRTTRSGERGGLWKAVLDQPLRPALQRGHGAQPGEDQPAGRRARRFAAPGQPGRFHGACRHPRRPARCALRDAHPHHRRRGRRLPEGRPAADQLLHRAAARHGGVPHLRRHHHPRGRSAAPAQKHW